MAPILVMALMLSGCAAKPSPDQVVAKFLDAIKSLNTEEMAKYVTPDALTPLNLNAQPDGSVEAEAIMSAFSRLTYKIQPATVSGDAATVPVSITSVNMGGILSEIMVEAFGAALLAAFSDGKSQEDLAKGVEASLIKALKDPDAPMVTTDVTISLKKTDGKWLIALDEESSKEFGNAICGGLGDFAEALSEGFGNVGK
jgi:hypothetical protein